MLSNIRLSDHNLIVEIENEEHFSIRCKNFQSKLLNLFSKIICNTMYDNLNFYEIFKLMLNNSSVFVLN